MRWFNRSKRSKAYAVLSPRQGGMGAVRLQVQGAGERPRVAAIALDQAATPDTLVHLAQSAGIRHLPLIALLATEHYQTVIVDAPNVPEDELRTAIRWKVKELLNFHVDDAVLDYLPIPAGGGRPPSLFVVAALATAVRALAQPFQDAGLELDVIDIPETAQHNLAMRLAPADYAVALLHFDGSNGLLTFSFGEALVLSRRIEGRGGAGDFLYEKIAMEVQRSVDYFERQFSWLPLAKLYLAPMTDAPALAKKLTEYLPVGVETLELSRLFDLTDQPTLEDAGAQNAQFHPLGAALREPA